MTQTATRTLSTIAAEIAADWPKALVVGPDFGFGPSEHPAGPYLRAMARMYSIRDTYGYDSGQSIVLYFLSNAREWRGDTARRVKAELKGLLK